MKIGTINLVFGALLVVVGIYIAAAGPSAGPAFGIPNMPPAGGGAVEVPAEWRLLAFMRMFGIILFMSGVMLWGVGRYLAPERVRVFAIMVAGASAIACVLAIIQQTALWNSFGGVALTALLALMALAYGWLAVRQDDDAPARPTGTLGDVE